ncbi:MAG: cytochrome c oxidase assembly protein [SAR202 cluster bacterium]|nr:cytochrome c oxidase assembly protein [SAR202 cluster bacterium]
MAGEFTGAVWTHWHGHPDVLIGLAALEAAYLLGVGPLREKYSLADSVDPKQVATFTAGVLVTLVALVSPLHVLGDDYLFSAHMVQHMVLMLLAAPLLIMGTPDWLLRPLLRPDWVFRTARVTVHPIMAFALFNVIFSMWHLPSLYNATLSFQGLHIFQHILLLAISVIMWWPLLSQMPELPRLSDPGQMLYLFVLSVASIIVFAPLAFARHPIYDVYAAAPRVWGLSPVVDQQIGAIIMKVGGGMLFMTLFIMTFFRWFGREEARAKSDRAQLGTSS